MYKRTGTILDQICENKEREVEIFSQKQSVRGLEQTIAKNNFPKRDFAGALRKEGVSLIAEIKRSSPSNKGIVFREDFDVTEITGIYEQSGASAISVITDDKFFMGKLEYLSQARQNSNLPILRKDFIIDPLQVYESKAFSADAILLITAILEKEQFKNLYDLACELDMDCLVEAHNEEEIKQALEISPKIIGINNRNLKTMEMNIKNFSGLAESIPNNIIKIAESGIYTHDDVIEMKNSGADAVLVGTSLIKADDIGQAVNKLLKNES